MDDAGGAVYRSEHSPTMHLGSRASGMYVHAKFRYLHDDYGESILITQPGPIWDGAQVVAEFDNREMAVADRERVAGG
ncbi:hypothetical protein [Streptomyces sp. AcH 505]|uniref:hypothetical protein n=1 Tax=Streptomyces sp. AcH 505 TaxID=352211 RepID=UPI0012FEB295